MVLHNLKVTTDVRSKLYRLRWHLAESSDGVGTISVYCLDKKMGFIFNLLEYVNC